MRLKKAEIIQGMGIRLRNAEVMDAEFILSLRTDHQLNQHISPVSGELSQQVDFLEKYKSSLGQAFFVIESISGDPLGTVRLYDEQGDSFCWGSWIVHPTASPRTGTKSALLVYWYAFEKLGFKASHFDVRQANDRVWRFHESWGARLIRENELDRFYELGLDAYARIKKRYSSLIGNEPILCKLIDN